MTFSKITPSLFTFKESFSRTLPSSLTLKGGSTALPMPLSPQGRGDVNRSYSLLGIAALQGRRGIKALVWGVDDCLCGVNRLAESLLVELCSAGLDTKSRSNGGEDGDEEVDDGFPVFFFHVISDFEV